MFDSFYNTYGFNYALGFGYRFALTVLVYGTFPLGAAIFLYIISVLIKRSIKNPRNQLSVRSNEEQVDLDLDSSVQDIRSYLMEEKAEKTQKTSIVKILQFLAAVSALHSLFFIGFAPAILSGNGIISGFAAFLIILSLFAIAFLFLINWYCPNFLRKHKNNNQSWAHSMKRKITITTRLYKTGFGLFFAAALLYSAGAPFFTADTCMNYFNADYGYHIQGLGMSTRLTRYFTFDTVCQEGQICHLYATLPEETETGVIFNIHTGPDVTSLTVGYEEKPKYEESKAKGEAPQVLPNIVKADSYYIDIETRGARYVHHAYISNLQPNTTYYFEVYYNNKAQRNGTYVTLPTKNLERNLTIAVGGDAGTTTKAQKMTAALENYPLDAIIVGGDLAYDNGMKSCYYSWDLFLGMFEKINQKLERVVPLIFSVGNHDIGFNAYQDGPFDKSINSYYVYFPQGSETTADGTLKAPAPKDRASYGYHTLGNTVHMSLDSGYELRLPGEQVDFVNKISAKYQDRVRMANFHVPMFPACFDNPSDVDMAADALNYWGPLFENNNFASVFENHKHLYKKTFPIKDGHPNYENDDGVVYFGDGNWGISADACLINGQTNGNHTGAIEVYSDMNHVWILEINPENLTYFAINPSGEIFDKKYNLTVSKYIN